jgi:hypothetical protein
MAMPAISWSRGLAPLLSNCSVLYDSIGQGDPISRINVIEPLPSSGRGRHGSVSTGGTFHCISTCILRLVQCAQHEHSEAVTEKGAITLPEW